MSADDLRIAQGQVRCGRCLAVFNALSTLYDDRPSQKSAARAETTPTSAAAETQETPCAVAEPDLSPTSDAHAQSVPVAASEEYSDPSPTDVQNVVETAVPRLESEASTVVTPALLTEHEATDTSPDDALAAQLAANDASIDDQPAANEPFIEDSDASANDRLVSEPLVVEQVAAEAEVPAPLAGSIDLSDDNDPLFMRPATEIVAAEDILTQLEESPQLAPQDAADPPAEETAATSDFTAPRRSIDWRWAVGCAVLLLLLAVQVLHINRDALATGNRTGPLLRSLYERLGAPIAPHWDVAAYEVRQQGAVGAADAAAPLTLRASIINRGERTQPLPLLRVTLQDRFGNHVALRDLQPREYLPTPQSAALLGPGQRVDAEVAMADPGGKAVGFEIDACLQVVPGRYSCANERPSGTR